MIRTLSAAIGLSFIVSSTAFAGDCEGRVTPARLNPEYVRIVEVSVQFISSHVREFSDEHNLESLMENADVPRRELHRAFRAVLNTTPLQYVIARRLWEVRMDLINSRNTKRNVTQIALSHGFHDLHRFSYYYKRQFGELPSQTRRSPKTDEST